MEQKETITTTRKANENLARYFCVLLLPLLLLLASTTSALTAQQNFKYKYWPTKLFQYHNQVNHLRKKNNPNNSLTQTELVLTKVSCVFCTQAQASDYPK